MLLKENAIVIVLAKSSKDLLWIKQKGPIDGNGSILTMLADYSDYYRAEEINADIINRFGKIDLSIACFEDSPVTKPLRQVDITEWDRVIEQNISAFFVAARLSFISMKKSRQSMFISLDFTSHITRAKGAKLARLSLSMQREMASMFYEETKDTQTKYYHLQVGTNKKKNDTQNNYIHPDKLGQLIVDLYEGHRKSDDSLFQWMHDTH